MKVRIRCLDCGFNREVSDPTWASELAEAHEEGRPPHNVVVDPYDEPTLGAAVPTRVKMSQLVSTRRSLEPVKEHGGSVEATYYTVKWLLDNWETPVSELGENNG